MSRSMKRAIIYCRQSSGKEEDSESIAFQEDSCRRFASEHGLTVTGVYSDANTPGRLYPTGAESLMAMDDALQTWLQEHTTEKRFRPGLGEAIAAFPSTDVLLVFDLSRLYRPVQNSYLQSYINSRILRDGVELISLKEGRIDFSNFTDALVSSIKSQVNDNQIALTREKAKQAMQRLQDSGYYPTRPSMYGIRYVGGRNRAVEVIPEKAAVIRHIYAAILKRHPYAHLLRELNDLFPGLHDGKCFYPTSWRHIIANPFYCGYMYDSHHALIRARQMEGKEVVSFREWKRANEIVNSPRTKPYERLNMLHPFSGLMVCGYCGSRMSVVMDHGKVCYACLPGVNLRHRPECGKSRTNITLVRRSAQFTGLKEAIRPILLLALFVELEELRDFRGLRRTIDEKENQLRTLDAKMTELAEAYASNALSSLHAYQKAFDVIEEKATALKNALVVLRERLTEVEQADVRRKGLLSRSRHVLDGDIDEPEYKELLHRSVHRIVCFEKHLEIETIRGTVTLKRRLMGHCRNFPHYIGGLRLFQEENGEDSCVATVTWLYGEEGAEREMADWPMLKLTRK